MDKLIEALQIFMKYGNPAFPTHCEHDILYVYPGVTADEMDEEDVKQLEELHFTPDYEFGDEGGWSSSFFGSC